MFFNLWLCQMDHSIIHFIENLINTFCKWLTAIFCWIYHDKEMVQSFMFIHCRYETSKQHVMSLVKRWQMNIKKNFKAFCLTLARYVYLHMNLCARLVQDKYTFEESKYPPLNSAYYSYAVLPTSKNFGGHHI